MYNNKTIRNVTKSVVQLTSPMTKFQPHCDSVLNKTKSQANVGRGLRPLTWPHQNYQCHESDRKGHITLNGKKITFGFILQVFNAEFENGLSVCLPPANSERTENEISTNLRRSNSNKIEIAHLTHLHCSYWWFMIIFQLWGIPYRCSAVVSQHIDAALGLVSPSYRAYSFVKPFTMLITSSAQVCWEEVEM